MAGYARRLKSPSSQVAEVSMLCGFLLLFCCYIYIYFSFGGSEGECKQERSSLNRSHFILFNKYIPTLILEYPLHEMEGT